MNNPMGPYRDPSREIYYPPGYFGYPTEPAAEQNRYSGPQIYPQSIGQAPAPDRIDFPAQQAPIIVSAEAGQTNENNISRDAEKPAASARSGSRMRVNSASISAVLAVFFFVCCLWVLINVFAYSRTESDPPPIERDLSAEYALGSENFTGKALEGIYSIDLTYIIPGTQIVAPEPDADCFGTAKNREELIPAAEQAEAFGLVSQEDLLFLRGDTPWTTKADAQYYLDKTIFAVTWKASIKDEVVNFSEIVIGHPSQFRKYLTDNKFASGKRKTVSSLSKEINAVIGMSADFYAYRRHGVVVQDGVVHRDNVSSLDNCFIDENGSLILAKRRSVSAKELPEFVRDNHINFSLSFGPILVEDSKISGNSKGGYLIGEPTGNFSRAAIGQLGDLHYLLCTIDGGTTSLGKRRDGTTVTELAKLMQSLGCVSAYTLDGGQTATMTVNGKVFNRVGYGSERPVSDIIYFATALPDGRTSEDANE